MVIEPVAAAHFGNEQRFRSIFSQSEKLNVWAGSGTIDRHFDQLLDNVMQTLSIEATSQISGGGTFLDQVGAFGAIGTTAGAIIGGIATGTLSGAASGAAGFGVLGAALGGAFGAGWALGTLIRENFNAE